MSGRLQTGWQDRQQVVLEDTNESRIVAQNWLDGQYNVVNLVRAAGMLQEPAVLVCLMFQHHTNTIVAQPLAVHARDSFRWGYDTKWGLAPSFRGACPHFVSLALGL